MYKFKVIGTKEFDNRILKILSKYELEEFTNFILKLKRNPFLGKPLTYNFFREKKIGGKRLYFLIYEDINLIICRC